MGFFSWITKEGRSISNIYSSRGSFTVYMHSPDGEVWEESKYEGYGVFGRKDYFELMAEVNGKKTREEGIDLYYDKDKTDLVYPILSEKKKWAGGFKVRNEDCPDQGYFYHDSEDSDDVEKRVKSRFEKKVQYPQSLKKAGEKLDRALSGTLKFLSELTDDDFLEVDKPHITEVYVVRDEEQGFTMHVASSLEKAREYFIDNQVKPNFDQNDNLKDEFEFNILNPITDNNYDELLEYFDWSIEKFVVDQ